jgi:membrane protein DedA with SNARE-associated domain
MDFISFYSILLGLAFYKLVKTVYSKEKNKQEKKRWLFEEIIHQYGGFAGIIIFRFIYSFKSLITQMILGNDYYIP